MKKLLILFISVLSICLSCGHKDDFSCDKNSTVNVNGKNECCFGRGTFYVYQKDIPLERIAIGFSYGAGSFNLGLEADEFVAGREYSYPGEASLNFPGFNKGGTGSLTIDAFDRENRTISGHFDMTAEGESNYSTYDYKVKGNFTDVGF